jgi:L-threonylcarbamoyladenylate synthase
VAVLSGGVEEDALAALRAGMPVVLPTDTVYGLCADAWSEEAVRRMLRLKKRPPGMPVAFVAADLDVVLDAVPELRDQTAVLGRLLPGPFTLILPNPSRRLRWLTGTSPDALGIRVPEMPPAGRKVLDRFGAVAATSANVHGGRDAASVDELPEELRSAVEAIVDAGPLPGTPSTVVDLTGAAPEILREGAVPAADTLALIARATR